MKKATNKTKLWYLGYAVCAVILLLIAFADLPRAADIGLSCAFGAIFGVSYSQLWYDRQVRKDPDFEVEVEDAVSYTHLGPKGRYLSSPSWLSASARFGASSVSR